MAIVSSFAPIINPKASILILGSMPGVASLEAQQYYAHPRNAFWPIMQAVYEIDASLPYEMKVTELQKNNVAVWDVLQHCERPGSLDSAIVQSSRQANDFETFFSHHLMIRQVVFNGATAEKVFRQMVLPNLTRADVLFFSRAPSTSPAHTMPLNDKIKHWKTILQA